MKKTISSACLFAFALLLNGCVTRTYVDAPQNRGASVGKDKYGSQSEGKVVSKQRVWFWQDEFRNP